MGDLNAKVGEQEDRDCGIGPYGLGKRNERGDMLATFCQANGFTITNTCFSTHTEEDTHGFHQEIDREIR